jgi:hypothetical protein
MEAGSRSTNPPAIALAGAGQVRPGTMRESGATPKFLDMGNLFSSDLRGTWLDERTIKVLLCERPRERRAPDR